MEKFESFIYNEASALGIEINDSVCKLTYILELHYKKCSKSAFKYYELGFSDYWIEARTVDSNRAKEKYLKCINFTD